MSGVDLRAAAIEWRDSEQVVRRAASPTGAQWQRVLEARAALRAALGDEGHEGITHRSHVPCCWCGEHHEEGD
jgi:hypothetical protein